MQDWFEAGAADGYWVSPDVYECGIAAFVEGVVPSCKQADSSTKITTAPPYVPISALELNTG
jgi:hypothetical protein